MMGITLDMLKEWIMSVQEFNRIAGFIINPFDLVGVAVLMTGRRKDSIDSTPRHNRRNNRHNRQRSDTPHHLLITFCCLNTSTPMAVMTNAIPIRCERVITSPSVRLLSNTELTGTSAV